VKSDGQKRELIKTCSTQF